MCATMVRPMACLMRPLRQWPLLHHHCCSHAAFNHLLSEHLIVPTTSPSHRLSFTIVLSLHRSVHYRSRGLKSPNALRLSDLRQEGNNFDSDSYSDEKKSRNEKKREARRAVLWGMELASFSTPQIKRILRVASLDQEVLDALMLVKRLGPDVREGKRRQYNLIGKLLRDVKPELMDALILAAKDGGWSRLRGYSDSNLGIIMNDDEEEESEETEYDKEEEGSHEYINIASKWLDGLISKDVEITNEVYAVRSVDFDRQELRKLVRKVHVVYERKDNNTEENEQELDAAIMAAKNPLARFLRALAKQMLSEPNLINDL